MKLGLSDGSSIVSRMSRTRRTHIIIHWRAKGYDNKNPLGQRKVNYIFGPPGDKKNITIYLPSNSMQKFMDLVTRMRMNMTKLRQPEDVLRLLNQEQIFSHIEIEQDPYKEQGHDAFREMNLPHHMYNILNDRRRSGGYHNPLLQISSER